MDMSTIKVGDKLQFRNLKIVTIEKITSIECASYPFSVVFEGVPYAYTKDGHYYSDQESGWDIIKKIRDIPKKKTKKTQRTKAIFVQEIEVIDPISKAPVHVAIYREESGGMFGVDSSYIEQEVDDVTSPFGNGILELTGD